MEAILSPFYQLGFFGSDTTGEAQINGSARKKY
jgi:hypothetical protein